jgi:hypothetical protein
MRLDGYGDITGDGSGDVSEGLEFTEFKVMLPPGLDSTLTDAVQTTYRAEDSRFNKMYEHSHLLSISIEPDSEWKLI